MSMILFKVVAHTNEEEGVYDTLKKITLQLSRKKYYSRFSRLTSASFIITQNGKHFLTLFGKVVHNAQMMIVNKPDNHWKPNAVYPARLYRHYQFPCNRLLSKHPGMPLLDADKNKY
jgi:hypothetical protein